VVFVRINYRCLLIKITDYRGYPIMGGPFVIAATGDLRLMVKVLLSEEPLGIERFALRT